MSRHTKAAASNDHGHSMFLADEEIRELTNRVHHSAQSSAMSKMGIEHITRPDGSLAVLRAHVESVLTGGKAIRKPKAAPEPNWGALGAKAA